MEKGLNREKLKVDCSFEFEIERMIETKSADCTLIISKSTHCYLVRKEKFIECE